MSYISVSRVDDEVYVWERGEGGKRDIKTFSTPYFFFTEHEDGEYVGLFGTKLRRHDFDSASEMQQAIRQCEANRIKTYESDIPPELKILSEHYYGREAPSLHCTFIDIEIDYNRELGFGSVHNPYAEINSVALHHYWCNRSVLLVIPPSEYGEFDVDRFYDEMNAVEKLPTSLKKEDIIPCSSEYELLLTLLVEIEDSDLLSGWNSEFFDIPYIGKRVDAVLGSKYFSKLSFPMAGKPRWRTVEKFNVQNETLELQGRMTLDYLDLFKKYEVAERPSYKLESIANEVLPDLPKLEYEGSLADLYRKDFAYFARYNVRDTEILCGFEDKLGYVALANEMYHISCGMSKHVGGTLKLAELAINNYCIHELNLRVPDNEERQDSAGIQGALVLEPKVGMHEWIGSMDINSLYPSSIRSINISPETLIGQFTAHGTATEEIKKESFVNLVLEYDDGRQEQRTAQEWRELLKENKWSVSGYGTVFTQEKQGVIPSILEEWYATRKKYKKLMKETDDKEQSAYYDRLQYVYKIKLNSLYGALNNRFFRYYDLRMGESTTGTGRMILRHMCSMAGKLLDDKYAIDAPSVVYGDTDSVYFTTHAEDKDEAIAIADTVCKQTNATFPEFMKETFLCNEGFDDIILAGREVVANRGIFVDKKRYVLRIVDDEGSPADKLKIMGLDTKRTTLPKNVSEELNSFVERLLKGESWDDIAGDIVNYKEFIRTTDDIMTYIGLPKGIKNIEEYEQQYKLYGDGTRLPGHVAAAIFYNLCLEKFNDKDNIPIVSGMKIKVFYLDKVYGKFKSIALPTDLNAVPDWFGRFIIDRDAHIRRLVDNPLNNIIKAIGKETPSKQSMLVDNLLDF